MATKTRGHKTRTIGVRVTSRQWNALEHIADQRDATISEVVREIISTSVLPYQNSNSSGLVLPDAAAVAR